MTTPSELLFHQHDTLVDLLDSMIQDDHAIEGDPTHARTIMQLREIFQTAYALQMEEFYNLNMD